jgi:GYF domain 2/Superinfection immunity protein
MSDASALVTVLFILGTAIALYMIPSAIAFYREHHYKWVILALNVFGGWTAVAYIVALVWAVWPRRTALTEPFYGDPVTCDTDGGRRIYARRGEFHSSAIQGDCWYYVQAGKSVGPVSKQALIEAALKGTLRGSDLVWSEGMSNWVDASRVLAVPFAS